MRTEIADFLPGGPQALKRRTSPAAADQPRERFEPPRAEPDRREDRSVSPSRRDQGSERPARAEPAATRPMDDRPRAPREDADRGGGAFEPGARRRDPAEVAAARAIERASENSALKRGGGQPTLDAGGAPISDGDAAPALPAAPGLGGDADAVDAEAVGAETLEAVEAAGTGEDGASAETPLPEPETPVPPAAQALPPEAPKAGQVADAGAALVAASEIASAPGAAAGEEAEIPPPAANAQGAPGRERAADGATPRDPAQARLIDGQAVSEAARALRAAPASDMRSSTSEPSERDEGGNVGESGGENVDAGADEGARPSQAESAPTRLSPVDEAARARGLASLTQAGAPPPQAGGETQGQPGLQGAGAPGETARGATPQTPAAPTPQPQVVVPQTALAAVPMAIGLKALNGVSSFQIRLDPAELGRIDVRLEIDEEGTVNAKLTVERVETLHLLQRDARTLERAFEQAGLKPSEGGVDLSLRDPGSGDRQPGREAQDERRPNAYGRQPGDGDPRVPADARPAETVIAREALRRALGGVDLRI